jgi:PAS domain S-box-containing protein
METTLVRLAEYVGKSPPQLGWRPTTLSAAVALILLIAGAWRVERNLVHAQQQIELRDQAQAAELALSAVLSALTDAETGQRGYLLTGDPSYLQPYTRAQSQIGAAFAALQAAPLQDSARKAGIARLHSLAARKLAVMSETLRLYEAGQRSAAIALVRSNLGLQLMDRIRTEAAAQQADIEGNLAAAERRLPVEGSWIWVGMLICAGSLLLGWIIFQQLRVTRYYAASTNRLERFTRAFGLGLGMIRTAGGRITVWSQGSERLYGYTAEEAVGQNSHELLCTHFPTPLAAIEAHLRREGFWQGELVHRRRDGFELRVQSHWALHSRKRGNDQAEDLVIEVNSDITSLAKTDALLRTILQTAPALIYAKDLDGRMLLANPPTLALLAKSWEEVEGRTDLELLANPAEAVAVMDNDRRLMMQAQVEFLEEQVGADAAGAPRIWSSCKAPMFDGSGAVMGMVGVSVEITANRRIEAQLRVQAAELERAYAEMGDFAHIIAHDLRAPLRAVKSLAAWIAQDVAPMAGPETLSDLVLLGKRVDRMALLLEGLLSFSRVGHAKAASEPLDIALLVAEIAEMLAPPPGMVVRYAGDNLTLHTPRPPLMHVLQNLISNAVKHHDRGRGDIVVTACRTEAGAVLSVADDGPGIPPAAHKRIFEIFQTLAVRPETETAGVGLSIVRKTVEAHGGKVWVESNPPVRGTKFSFTWPEAAAAASTTAETYTLPADPLTQRSPAIEAPAVQVEL